MQPIFTLQYAEYSVANFLKENIKESSVFIPLSAQEKGIDLLVTHFDGKNTNVQAVQIKSSRTYFPKKTSDHICGYFWFNTFKIPDNADWIIFVGIVPLLVGKNVDGANVKFKCKYLCMSNEEAKTFISNIKTKKGAPDKMFGFCYDEDDNFYLSRGGDWQSLNQFKIENQIEKIKEKLI